MSLFLTLNTNYSGVSIVDFEQVNAGWVYKANVDVISPMKHFKVFPADNYMFKVNNRNTRLR